MGGVVPPLKFALVIPQHPLLPPTKEPLRPTNKQYKPWGEGKPPREEAHLSLVPAACVSGGKCTSRGSGAGAERDLPAGRPAHRQVAESLSIPPPPPAATVTLPTANVEHGSGSREHSMAVGAGREWVEGGSPAHCHTPCHQHEQQDFWWEGVTSPPLHAPRSQKSCIWA